MNATAIGRRVVERGTTSPIGLVIDWQPLTAALCDTLVKFPRPNRYGHRECWYSLQELREVDGKGELPRRDQAIIESKVRTLENLKLIRGLWIRDDFCRPWPGCEFGKVHLGNAINAAIEELENETGAVLTMLLITDPSDIFNSLVCLSDWAYRQGEMKLKSSSGADQSESELYIEESRFWQRVAAGCPVSQALRLSETYWRAYVDEIQQRIASAPKVRGSQHPREGQSTISHRYVDVEMWACRVRNVIEPWLSRVFVNVEPPLSYFCHPTYNELDHTPKPSIRYFARYRVEREKRDNGDATYHDSMRYSLLFGPFREYQTVIDLINNLVGGVPARPRYGQDIVACSVSTGIVKQYTLRGRLNTHPDYIDLYRNSFLEESRVYD